MPASSHAAESKKNIVYILRKNIDAIRAQQSLATSKFSLSRNIAQHYNREKS